MRRKNNYHQSHGNLDVLPHISGVEAPQSINQTPFNSRLNPIVQECYVNQGKSQKYESQLDRMEQWMGYIYSQKKQENERKRMQRQTSNTRYSFPQKMEESNFKLPKITNYPTKENSEEEKLLQEIQKMKSQLKQVKLERQLARSRNDKAQYLKPFMELHQENLKNMQFFSRQNHNCCNHERGCKRRDQPRYLQQEQNSQNIIKSQPKRKPRKNLKRKFRACVIAVYFTVMFPKYVSKFSAKRYKIYLERYPYLNNIANDEEEVLQITKNGIITLIERINFFSITDEVLEMKKTKKSVVKTRLMITNGKSNQENFGISISEVEDFLAIFLQRMIDTLEEEQPPEEIMYLKDLLLPSSFPLDNFFTEEQVFRTQFHQQKNYIKIDQQQSKCFIMSYVFVKVMLLQYVLKLNEDYKMKKKIMKMNGVKTMDSLHFQLTIKYLYFASVSLFKNCLQIFKRKMGDLSGNYEHLNPSNRIMATQLLFNETEDFVFMKQNIQEQSGNKPEDLNKFQYIDNIYLVQGYINMVEKESVRQTQIQLKIERTSEILYFYLLEYRKDQYQKITSFVLQNWKKLESSQIQQQLYALPKRSKEEKKEIKILAQVIANSRTSAKKTKKGHRRSQQIQQKMKKKFGINQNEIKKKLKKDRRF